MTTLVTGAAGHLGFNLVQWLHARGERVRAAVRSLADPARIAPLRALAGVELVEADVTRPEQVRAAMAGIETLHHVAAVYSTAEPGREREILETSRLGVEHALRAAADAGVRKVVLTSSIVTLPLTAPGAPPSDERHWQDNLSVPYFRAKTDGEQRAWALARELGINLATILPAGIIGPGFQRNTPTIDIVEAAAKGAFRLGAPAANFSFVDVRDVARAHQLAAERDAQGRFIVVDVLPSFRDIVRALHEADPRIRPALLQLPGFTGPLMPWFDRFNQLVLGTPPLTTPEVVATAIAGRRFNVSRERAERELGWRPQVPFVASLRDTLAVLRARAR